MLFLQPVVAQQEYYYKQISLNEGLTQSTVSCILTDHRGFVWIGTKYGLNRFNRYELKSYFYNRDRRSSLPGNQINFILEDKAQNLWISTEKGLVRYNADTDDFTRINYRGKPIIVGSALEASDGVWFGGNGAIYKFGFNSANSPELRLAAKIQSNDVFTGIKAWTKDIMLLSTRREGMWLYNLANRKLIRAGFTEDREIMSMHIDSKARVWISPYGNGIKGYDRNGVQFAHYNSSNSNLNNDVVLDMEEKDGKIWLGTDGGGISILEERKKQFTILNHIPGNGSSLPESSILTLYKDRENNIWAGSIRGGLIAIKPVFFHTYREAPLNSKYGLSEKTVLSLYEDEENMLWVGNDGGGVNQFDPKDQTFKHYPSTYGMKIASITGFGANELLISAFSNGVYVFNKTTGKIIPFMPNFSAVKQYKGLAINLNKATSNRLYLYTDKIFSYEIAEKRMSFVTDPDKSAGEGSLLKIYSDQRVTFLFNSYGIFQLDHSTNQLKTIFTLKQRDNPITAVTRDTTGMFWLANRDGLMYYDARKKVLRKIKTSLFESVSSVVADHENRLWIGARNMIFMYLIDGNKFVSFGESDGIIPNEFLSKPTLVTKNGDIYMGGVKGLLYINKNIPSLSSALPVIELMNLELNGMPLNATKEGLRRKASVPWNHSSLIVSVMARENDVFRKKMFRFEIKGMDFKPVETYDHAFAIGSLSQGKYRIIVSCSLKNGSWSKPVEVLQITVTPPWFLSFWFICFIGILLASVLLIIYKVAIAKKERKLQWDKKEHEQQTYETKIKFLINISHELRTPLTLIYSPLRRLLNGKDIDEELSKKLNGIYSQANHMKEIIDMVLDVRKIDLGKERLHLESSQLNKWVVEIADKFCDEFEVKRIQLTYNLDENIHEISYDLQKCEIILTNLLVNALKFSPEDTLITLSTQVEANFVRVAIRDQGIGLKNVDLNDLFKTFYQGPHQFGGSGIGLSYSKVLIEMHGGNIGAIDNVDEGATFYFELPYQISNANKQAVDSRYLALIHGESDPTLDLEESLITNSYSLLIIEDDLNLRTFLKDNLSPHFKTIYQASNGKEALDLLEKSSSDFIISDVRMPEMDGFEFCRRLKEDLRISHIPIMLLTTQGDLESRQIGYKLGADAYLSKPFDLDFLLIRINNIVKNREVVKSRYKHRFNLIEPEGETYSRADERFIKKLNSLIIENMGTSELHVDFLIDKMAMSRASLYSKLKSIGDIGVNEYINQLRLQRAAHLLLNTDKSIMEITDGVGFANQRYFSTVFKQYYKCTPSEYRKTAIA